jgi:uncharacterized OsmC-like protein
MIKVSIEYEGGLRCKATHGPSGVTLQTDAPVDNHGKGEQFSPSDLVATALGSCIATVLGIVAERKGWDLKGLRVEVSKDMSQGAPRRIARLFTEVWPPLSLSPADRDLAERTARTCPVHSSLHPEIDAPIVFHWNDVEAVSGRQEHRQGTGP